MNAPAGVIEFTLNGAQTSALPGETLIEVADRLGVDDPAPLLQAGDAARRQLPLVHGRDQGRARAGAVVLPRHQRRAWTCRSDSRARRPRAEDRSSRCSPPTCRRASTSPTRSSRIGSASSASASRASRRARSPRPTSRIRRWRSTSTRASSARAACARAARSRSTTSSATRSAARTRRSCSTSTTRWARRPASPAANACRRARRARSRRRTTPISRSRDRTVPSVCPYCGVGCQITYHVKDNAIVRVEGRDGPANHERLCVKGRFGFDYVHHPQRLTSDR